MKAGVKRKRRRRPPPGANAPPSLVMERHITGEEIGSPPAKRGDAYAEGGVSRDSENEGAGQTACNVIPAKASRHRRAESRRPIELDARQKRSGMTVDSLGERLPFVECRLV
jgi:hypothetical protein